MVILIYLNLLFDFDNRQNIIFIFAPNIDNMAEKIKSTHGGKRVGAGRPSSPDSKVQITLKLDRDLSNVFKSPMFTGTNRGRYINEAVRAKMKEDGYI